MKLCTVCGTPSPGSRCPQHTLKATTARGYDSAWTRLSKKARRLQPFCTDCGALHDLQLDHSPEAWRRWEQHKPIRLQDVAVVCGPCNRKRGAARGEKKFARDVGGDPASSGQKTHAQSKFASQMSIILNKGDE